MGFDNECILNIQSLAGEYFCPVCRLLVYPNEALQSQCTHLYCKPCLNYVVGTTQACPYDGYLVTEADSKPLTESNKALAETIGKIVVHCLYHRSGCQWQGPLSDCTTHCSGCAFGNSPVVCNRCGIQIVHRQVQEHAQTCAGVQSQPPQVAEAVSAANAENTQTANQSGISTSLAKNSQTAAGPPAGLDQNPQANATSQSQTGSVAPAVVPTPEQWYQQQYHQYYQQYPGYDPYQQPYQNYYPYQQQVMQQYQQHPPHVLGQPQPQVYTQPQSNIQSQPQVQLLPQSQPQAQIQPHVHPQPPQPVHAAVPTQPSVNPQAQLHAAVQPSSQMQSQAHPPPHGPSHPQPQQYAGAQPHPQHHLVQPPSQQSTQMPQYQQPQSQMQHPHPQMQSQPPLQIHPPHQSLQTLQPQAVLKGQPQPQLPQPHPQLQPPPQHTHLVTPNAQTQTQHPSGQAVTGHPSYPQPQAQMHLGAQQPPHMHPQSGSLPQHPVQMHGQFPQQPQHIRPPQPHTPGPNQQRPVLMPPQGQFPSIPTVQQHPIQPHSQQPGHPGDQRPVMQPMQSAVPLQHLQNQQPFQGQTSGPVPNQLHSHGQFVQQQPQLMQSQSRPPGPPHSVLPSQQNVALSHGLPPHQSQNYAARPMMPNHGAQSQPFPQLTQVRPMQLGANQPNQNFLLRTNNQLHTSSEQQRQGDHMPEKIVADQKDGSPSKITAQKEPNGLVPTSSVEVEVNNLTSETDVLKPIRGEEDNNSRVDMHGKVTGSDSHAVGSASTEPAITRKVKKEGDESRLQSSPGDKYVESGDVERRDATDVSRRGEHSTGEDISKEHIGKLPKDAVDAGLPVSSGAVKGSQAIPHTSGSSAHSQTPLTGRDHMQHTSQERNLSQYQSTLEGRHQHMPMHYGPPAHPQRPTGAAMSQGALLPGPPHLTQLTGNLSNVLRPQGPGLLPQPGQPFPDHFQTSVMKQPHGSFHPEIASGIIPGPSSASIGREPSHFGPPASSFEPSSVAPHGYYNQSHAPPPHAGLPRMSQGESPGSFNSLGGIMGRAPPPPPPPPPHGPEGQIGYQRPMFPEQRSNLLSGRQPDPHLIGSSERAPFGHSPAIESNVMRMNEAAGPDPSFALGFRDEKFKRQPEEGFNRFPMEPARHFDRDGSSRPLDKASQGLNYDAGLNLDPGSGGAPRFLPPHHPGGSNDSGDRARPFGPDGGIGRADSSRSHPDFPGPVPVLGRHHKDYMPRRSPGREYHGFPARFPSNQSGPDDTEGRESRPFGEGPRSFNFPSHPVGNSFHESRFPLLPGQLRRGEQLDGPGIVRNSDLTGQDIPSHLRRGEFMGPRQLPGHLRFGEPIGFGDFSGHVRLGDLAGPGNFPHHLPHSEPFGVNKIGHPRLGEPGFRSSYSLTGGMDPFDNSRKRKAASMGWCRICKVDCETVEGLDLHAQTREHQKMAMDMVLSIKQQNAMKQKTSKDHSSIEEPSKPRGAVREVRGNKP